MKNCLHKLIESCGDPGKNPTAYEPLMLKVGFTLE